MAYNDSPDARVIYHDSFEGRGFTDQNSLAQARLTKPDKINSTLTFLQGNPSKRFPLTFMTEGQKGGMDYINDIEYEWDTMRSLTKPSKIAASSYGAGDKAGIARQPITLVMEDDWLKYQHKVQTPNGRQMRVQTRGKRVSNGFEYTFQLITNDDTDYVDYTELGVGVKLSMIGLPNVSESLSMGNESNKVFPGKMKNQISISRKSRHIGGNVKNKVVEVQFRTGNTVTSKWEPFEEWQFELELKQMMEEDLWFSQYNRNANGEITTIDPDNGLPIPMGAGIEYQIPNKDTYSKLTIDRLKRTVGDIFYGATDQENMIVTLFTGQGGMEEFDNAVKQEAGGFASLLSGAAATDFVKQVSGGLSFGNYFKVYQHVDGHMIVLKHLPLLDKGGRTENVGRHPITGRPITSYDMYYLDMSSYDGVNNIQMVSQKGRSYIRGVLKGMAPAPDHFKWTGNDIIATEQDKTSLHIMLSKGVRINRNTHCFKLEFDSSSAI